EPVETAHLVGAVIRAIPCSETTVVSLLVQPVGRVHGCQHRTNRFARRVIAMLTKHGLMHDFNIFGILLVDGIVPVNPDPVHFPPASDLVLSYYGHVVFHAAAHHTGAASGAGVQVNGHSPVMAGFGMLIPQ